MYVYLYPYPRILSLFESWLPEASDGSELYSLEDKRGTEEFLSRLLPENMSNLRAKNKDYSDNGKFNFYYFAI